MDSEEDLLINPADFKSMELEINFTNTTTRTEVQGDCIIMSGEDGETRKKGDYTVTIVELLEEGAILGIPKRTCAEGHKLQINFSLTGTEFPIQFDSLCEVIEHSKGDEDRDRVVVKYKDFDDRMWNLIRTYYDGRQEQVTEFFKAAKGL